MDDLATALVHLLRNCDAAEFKKYCPGVTQRGSCTSVSEMLLAMFRALHGDIVETGEVLDDDEAKPAARLCVAYALAPKVGRPRREVALREEAEKLAKEQAEERRRKHVLAQHGGGETKHEFGSPANRGQVCGVCSSTWEPECGWEKGNGCWACFACQVYICSWECLNIHNKEGSGNTVRGASVIYKTKPEYEAAKAARKAAGKGKRKS